MSFILIANLFTLEKNYSDKLTDKEIHIFSHQKIIILH